MQVWWCLWGCYLTQWEIWWPGCFYCNASLVWWCLQLNWLKTAMPWMIMLMTMTATTRVMAMTNHKEMLSRSRNDPVLHLFNIPPFLFSSLMIDAKHRHDLDFDDLVHIDWDYFDADDFLSFGWIQPPDDICSFEFLDIPGFQIVAELWITQLQSRLHWTFRTNWSCRSCKSGLDRTWGKCKIQFPFSWILDLETY